jgi:hypothetical protein
MIPPAVTRFLVAANDVAQLPTERGKKQQVSPTAYVLSCNFPADLDRAV